jgi:O-antigen/teichoic acid export membrane protein
MTLATNVVETNPTEEVGDLSRAVGASVAALTARYGVTKLIGIAGSIILAHVLFPSDYGVFALALLLIGAVMMVNDLGLGSSLVQQQAEPTRAEMQAIFTFQQAIVLAAVVTIFLLAPVIGAFYHLSASAVWLTRFMGLYVLATSFRWMPSVLLTRRVRFTKMAIVDVVTAVIYQLVTVGGALAGLRFWALGLGLTVYAVSNALLINVLAPWPMGWRWNWAIVRAHLRFGIPYQGTVLVAALETAAGPVLLGVLSGSAAIGYATFALSLVNFGFLVPLLILQVGFPAMSRIQHDPERLAKALEVAIKANCYLLYGAYLPLLLFGGAIVRIVFSGRWLPAVPLLLILLWWGLLRSLLTMAATALNALGKSILNFWLHLAPAAASWLLIGLLVPRRGLIGFGEALLITAIPVPLSLVYLKRFLPLRLVAALLRPTGLFLAVFLGGRIFASDITSGSGHVAVMLAVVATLAVYATGALLLERELAGRVIATIHRYLLGPGRRSEARQSA